MQNNMISWPPPLAAACWVSGSNALWDISALFNLEEKTSVDTTLPGREANVHDKQTRLCLNPTEGFFLPP